VVELDANNARLEFESAAREIALWIHGESDFKKLGELGDYGDIGIMVTPQHLRLLENSLSRYRIPYNAQIRGTAGETIFGDLPRLVWNAYASGWDYRETLRFLNDPLISGGADSCMDLDDAATLQPNSADKWKVFLKGSALTDVLGSAEELCRALAEPHQPKEIIESWKNFVEKLTLLPKVSDYAGEDFSFDEVVKDISSALTELDKKSRVLSELTPDIGEAAAVTLAGADAVRYITDWALTATLPIPLPQSHSVTIYAGQPPVLAHHKYWMMTDIDYNTWPGKLRESPLLSNDGKQRLNESSKDAPAEETLHVPDTHDEREQKEALFRRLTAVGDSGIIIARSLTDANGRPAGRSQFTDALFSTADKARCWTTLGKVEYPLSKALPKDGEFCFAGAEIPLDAAKTERWNAARTGALPCDEKAASISMSSIDDWAACPFYYMCKYKYGLKPQSTTLFDPALAGDLVHELWCDAWKEYKKDSTKSFAGLSEKLWEMTLRKKYPALETDGRLNRRHLPRVREQVRGVALLQDEILQALGERRLSTDTEIELPEFEIDGVKFTGRADRIDRFKNGVVIIDYKSNESKKHTKDIQLAAYARVLEKNGTNVLGYGWIGHADAAFSGYFQDSCDDIRNAYKTLTKPNTKIETMIKTAEQTMQDMAHAVKNGTYPARYDAKKQCRICGYQAICRKLELQTAEQDDDEGEDSGNDQ
jgi:CRISPR/Cas system-associated exonuclease Cas4 (RecB family)